MNWQDAYLGAAVSADGTLYITNAWFESDVVYHYETSGYVEKAIDPINVQVWNKGYEKIKESMKIFL